MFALFQRFLRYPNQCYLQRKQNLHAHHNKEGSKHSYCTNYYKFVQKHTNVKRMEGAYIEGPLQMLYMETWHLDMIDSQLQSYKIKIYCA